jgi:hypothetical protein
MLIGEVQSPGDVEETADDTDPGQLVTVDVIIIRV